ncbi:bifunctional indole-3-glycerol phosphate synthase/phosphoribosylanthranilate isomerase [Helicobacter muridarum]|uniref:N-(5'-phosphoribosyl)anthranilate isomerase n=1 Tax=Helicobacter muridarum TaxID=216 RepID=A0A377PVE8_9HELI|nr:bifunctional indole-3-glycerol phosphate synthase/phosphoribosylanthranilate isomerase [Helicobacter muridarum]TLE00581.1 bifunctional indole-3-glycerol phosphate synthase/phosphoribosylanthranilate isomerase [Helicobacter muridarum]STQ85593.1 phosphoribosylanthranilate isomerase [Helicobacter muridarum]
MLTKDTKQQNKNQFSDIKILEKICQTKLSRMKSLGFNLGYEIPTQRELPLVKPTILQSDTTSQKEINNIINNMSQKLDLNSYNTQEETKSISKDIKQDFAKNQNNMQSQESTFIIAEIKRASPTHGKISSIPNPINLAKEYIRQGANAISILCEEDYFQGSIKDLQNVKSAIPYSCILRKDFILCKEEIEVSYLAGADMVLLIAGIFLNNFEQFKGIYDEIIKFNLTPLLEIHNETEWDFISKLDLRGAIVGINCRDLRSFNINKMNTLKLRSHIPSNIPVIFESGITNANECYIIANSGFNGILCGSFLVSSVMNTSQNKQSKQIDQQNQSVTLFQQALKQGSIKSKCKYRYMPFYKELLLRFHLKNEERANTKSYSNTKQENTQNKPQASNEIIKAQIPLIKICGINNLDFLDNALDKADLIGFILIEESPRFVDNDFVKKANEKIRNYILSRDLTYGCDSSLKSNKMINEGGLANHSEYTKRFPLRIGVVRKDSLQIGLKLLQEGLLDALQLHEPYNENEISSNKQSITNQNNKPQEKTSNANATQENINSQENYFPCYHALKAMSLLDIQAKNTEQSLQTQYFTLIDSSQGKNVAIDTNMILQITQDLPQFTNNLWLAGGINEKNLINILNLNPMLIDICSGLESERGIKDISKLNAFFDTIESIFNPKELRYRISTRLKS